MYNSQEIANRIKEKVKEQNKTINEVLIACELGKNTISKIANGTDIYSKNLAKIADYLHCSVDYLLGRTNESTKIKGSAIIAGNIKDTNIESDIIEDTSITSVNIENTTIGSAYKKNNTIEQMLNENEVELLKIYRSLDVREKTKLMTFIFEMEDKSNKVK